jgi:hypothetical protein
MRGGSRHEQNLDSSSQEGESSQISARRWDIRGHRIGRSVSTEATDKQQSRFGSHSSPGAVVHRQSARFHGNQYAFRSRSPKLNQDVVDRAGPKFRRSLKFSHGAWATGQKHQNRITLCVLDLGKGIPTTLQTLQKYRRHKDPHLIELATEEGVSSVPGNRGRGLSIIRRFVRSNGGAMTIISGNGRVRFRSDRRPMRDRIDGHFPGTAVFLSLAPTKIGLYVLDENGENQ